VRSRGDEFAQPIGEVGLACDPVYPVLWRAGRRETSVGREVSQTTTQEDPMQTDSYARPVAVDGAARPTSLLEAIAG
jgi:hypothetical protein